MEIDPHQAQAFRLAAHHLSERLERSAPGNPDPLLAVAAPRVGTDDPLLMVAANCGIQNTPPGAAAISLHARLADFDPAQLDRALEQEKTLLQVWSLRGAPHIFPPYDAAPFTLGLLPAGETELRGFLPGAEAFLKSLEATYEQALVWVSDAIHRALDGRVITQKAALDRALAAAILPRLTPSQQKTWQQPSGLGGDQTLGEAVTSFLLRPAALRGAIVFAPQAGENARFARAADWLGAPLPAEEPDQAGTELVRRYLRCYGPSTVAHFAAWAGVAPMQARRLWALAGSDRVEVRYQGKLAFLLRESLPGLESPPQPHGARLLPAHDPLLQGRDRAALVPDPALWPKIWRTVGSPGVALVDGQAVATWRANQKGRRLLVTLEPFPPGLPPATPAGLEEEAAGLARLRGLAAAQVSLSVV